MTDIPSRTGAREALAAALCAQMLDRFGVARDRRTVIGVAGESGSGKSITAIDLASALQQAGIAAMVLHQDDYFHRPPLTNHEAREADLSTVGPQEVDLARLATHVAAFRRGENGVAGPAVDYAGNRFGERRLDFEPVRVLVVEGTYVLGLSNLDVRIFLDATHADTAERRRRRNRDVDAPIVDRVLDIEHALIAPQASVADVRIDASFQIVAAR